MTRSWGHTIRALTAAERLDLARRETQARLQYPGQDFGTDLCRIGRSCRSLAAFEIAYSYVTGRAGRTSYAVKLACSQHGEAFREKHGATQIAEPIEHRSVVILRAIAGTSKRQPEDTPDTYSTAFAEPPRPGYHMELRLGAALADAPALGQIGDVPFGYVWVADTPRTNLVLPASQSRLLQRIAEATGRAYGLWPYPRQRGAARALERRGLARFKPLPPGYHHVVPVSAGYWITEAGTDLLAHLAAPATPPAE